MRGTAEQRQFMGAGNIENQNFYFEEQSILFQGSNGTSTPHTCDLFLGSDREICNFWWGDWGPRQGDFFAAKNIQF